MGYVPEYAKGQILVVLKTTGNNFARTFGERLGYRLANKRRDDLLEVADLIGCFVYDVGEGREQEAIKQFESYGQFVEWADRRDLKWESRQKSLEEAIDRLERIRDDASADISDRVYGKLIKDFSDYLLSLVPEKSKKE
jgi:hypothetical protein